MFNRSWTHKMNLKRFGQYLAELAIAEEVGSTREKRDSPELKNINVEGEMIPFCGGEI